LLPELAARYQVFPYLHEEMGAALAAADLVVCRAGASTLGELPLFGIPAILVPYPHAWRYQQVNAEYLAQYGAAVILQDNDLNEKLMTTIQGLFREPQKLEQMRINMRSLIHPQAAQNIANLIYSLVQPDGGA
jgi:UDP-N-acetylglucosamine--N-acetylmuramyl-(pentapeptide) pyrophosphoryl-undecaprenol N-acetylglucosamine transferase